MVDHRAGADQHSVSEGNSWQDYTVRANPTAVSDADRTHLYPTGSFRTNCLFMRGGTDGHVVRDGAIRSDADAVGTVKKAPMIHERSRPDGDRPDEEAATFHTSRWVDVYAEEAVESRSKAARDGSWAAKHIQSQILANPREFSSHLRQLRHWSILPSTNPEPPGSQPVRGYDRRIGESSGELRDEMVA
jgi:hypothetical protein